jgi:hypothetical protein
MSKAIAKNHERDRLLRRLHGEGETAEALARGTGSRSARSPGSSPDPATPSPPRPR